MRLSLRFIVPLLVVLTLFAYGMAPLVDRLMTQWFVKDLELRTNLITNTIQDNLVGLIKQDSRSQIQGLFNRLIKDEFGKDDGSELPDMPGVSWTIDRIDM